MDGWLLESNYYRERTETMSTVTPVASKCGYKVSTKVSTKVWIKVSIQSVQYWAPQNIPRNELNGEILHAGYKSGVHFLGRKIIPKVVPKSSSWAGAFGVQLLLMAYKYNYYRGRDTTKVRPTLYGSKNEEQT